MISVDLSAPLEYGSLYTFFFSQYSVQMLLATQCYDILFSSSLQFELLSISIPFTSSGLTVKQPKRSAISWRHFLFCCVRFWFWFLFYFLFRPLLIPFEKVKVSNKLMSKMRMYKWQSRVVMSSVMWAVLLWLSVFI